MRSQLANGGKQKNSHIEWVVFAAVLLFRILLNLSVKTIHMMPDEFGAIAGGAYMAGYDWSGVTSVYGYYGFGQAVLYAPFIYFIDNVLVQYQCILAMNAVLQTIPVLLCYRMMTRYYNVEDTVFAAIVSAGASLFVPTRASMSINEHVLILCMWVFVYAFTVQLSEKTTTLQKIRAAIFAVLCLFWTLLSHTRALVIVMGVVAVVVFYLLVYRRWVISPYVLVPGVIGAILVSEVFIGSIQNALYKAGEVEVLVNSTDDLFSGVPRLSEILHGDYLWQGLGILSGNIYATSTYSGMLITFTAVVLVVALFALLYSFFKTTTPAGTLAQKWVARADAARQNSYADILPGATLCLLCGVAVMLFLSYSWMPRDGYPYISGAGARAVFYLRYYLNFTMPLIMFGFIILYRNAAKLKWYFLGTLVLFLVFKEFLYAVIVPTTVSRPNWHLDAMYWMAPLSFRRVGEKLHPSSFVLISGITLAVFGIVFLLFRKRKYKALALVLTLLYAYEYAYGTVVIEATDANNNYNQTIEIIEIVQDVADKDEILYTSLGMTNLILLQYHVQNVTVLNGLPEQYEGNEIVVASSNLLTTELENTDILLNAKCVVAENKRRVYLLGEEKQAAAEALGYELVDANAITFKPSGMAYTSGAFNVGSLFAIAPPEEIIYGPYITLNPGTYSFEIQGINLEDVEFLVTAQAGAEVFEIDDLEITDTRISGTFVLEELAELVEFVLNNHTEKIVGYTTLEVFIS